MANSKNRNAALSSIKMQAANEVGVPLKDHGYNGDLTAKQVGSVGGQMVKKMMPKLQYNYSRISRREKGHKKDITYHVIVVV